MPYTQEELLNAENPYELLSTGDALAEHCDILNSLTESAQKKLAIKMILGCPADQLNHYKDELNALNVIAPIFYHSSDSFDASWTESAENSTSSSNSTSMTDLYSESEHDDQNNILSHPQFASIDRHPFYKVITQALLVRDTLLKVMDPENTLAYKRLLDPEADAAMIEFKELARQVIEHHELLFAENLAVNTPREYLSQMLYRASFTLDFPNLLRPLNLAVTLKREIYELIGPDPQKFFESREIFDDKEIIKESIKNSLQEFSHLFQAVSSHEREIAEKLIKCPSKEIDKIKTKLDKLTQTHFENGNPFKTISEALNEQLRIASVAQNRNTLFARSIPLDRGTSPETRNDPSFTS